MVKVACAVCGKHESDQGVKLLRCTRCKSVSYCGKQCQRADWKAGHKKICGCLNYGDAQQITMPEHTERREMNDRHMDYLLSRDFFSRHPDFELIWDLFRQSQDEDSHATKVNLISDLVADMTDVRRKFFFFKSLQFLSVVPTDMLELPTSPLKIVLELVDPNARIDAAFGGNPERGETALHGLVALADARNEVANANQCIMAKQLLEAGAMVDARNHLGCTPLHEACRGDIATNLDFLRLLLDHGADPNAANDRGLTPLYRTIGRPLATGAAKFLLEYSDRTDPNIIVSVPETHPAYGRSFLALVRIAMERTGTIISNAVEDEELRVRAEFLLGQLRELEELLVERGALDIRPNQG